MSLVNTLYHVVLRRTSTFWLASFTAVFIMERIVDVGCDAYFDNRNRGKQWKDIKHKYEASA